MLFHQLELLNQVGITKVRGSIPRECINLYTHA